LVIFKTPSQQIKISHNVSHRQKPSNFENLGSWTAGKTMCIQPEAEPQAMQPEFNYFSNPNHVKVV
jgi:hypothetical protein